MLINIKINRGLKEKRWEEGRMDGRTKDIKKNEKGKSKLGEILIYLDKSILYI